MGRRRRVLSDKELERLRRAENVTPDQLKHHAPALANRTGAGEIPDDIAELIRKLKKI